MSRRDKFAVGTRTALVTGASRGIGRSCALQLAQAGYNVVMVAVDEAQLERAAEEVRATNPAVWVRSLSKDLATVTAAEELFAWVKAEGMEIDVLVNNAGIFSFCDILDTPVERIYRIIMLHDITATVMCRLFAADMASRGGGRIMNMSSYSIWMPYPGLSLYSASKAYLKSFSVAFSKEVRELGVTVTAVCPAGIATDLYGLPQRWQKIGMRLGVLMSPDSCARRSLKAMWRGRRCIVPDWWFRLLIPFCRMVSGPLMRWLRNYTMQFQK